MACCVSADEAVNDLISNESIQNVAAVQNKEIYVVNFAEFMSFNARIYGALENLAKEMHPELY